MAKHKGLSEAEIRERRPTDPVLTCPIDNKLFKLAVKTPCCGTVYCEDCINNHLLERDFVCPSCGSKIQSLGKLVVDKPTRTKVNDYIDREIEKSKHDVEDEAQKEIGPLLSTENVSGPCLKSPNELEANMRTSGSDGRSQPGAGLLPGSTAGWA